MVIKDPHSGIKFVYRVEHDCNNLDAAAITELDETHFDGKRTTAINGMNYRMGNPDSAMKLLRVSRAGSRTRAPCCRCCCATPPRAAPASSAAASTASA